MDITDEFEFGGCAGYEDLLYLQAPITKHRNGKQLVDRAAQFSSFAALTGYEEAISETSRYTEEEGDLTMEMRDALDIQFREILQMKDPLLEITYFQPDDHKQGGSYEKIIGRIKKIDEYKREILFKEGYVIGLDSIVELTVKQQE